MSAAENIYYLFPENSETPKPKDLDLVIATDGELALIEATGKLDKTTSDYASGMVRQIQHDPNVQAVALDMRKVSEIDAVGLRFIAHQRHELTEANKTLELHNPSQFVTQLLNVTGLIDHIPVKYTDQELRN